MSRKIYKIKRFSCYSQQKEYGIKDYFNKARIKVANVLEKSANKNDKKLKEYGQKLKELNNTTKLNPKLFKNIQRTAKNQYNTRVIKNLPEPNPRNRIVPINNFDENDIKTAKQLVDFNKEFGIEDPDSIKRLRYVKKLVNESKNENKKIINLVDPVTSEALAHELGHLKLRESKIGRKIDEIRKTIEKDKPKSIKQTIAVLADEKLATRNGIDILKKHGATKEEIKNAKEFLNTAGKTYKEGAKSDLKKNLSNFIKPKHE